jgi:uncharacterized protein YjiS (DUF1127 family)
MSTLTLPGSVDASAGKRMATRYPNRLRALAERAIAWVARELSVRRTARVLARLDDRTLRDIGLERSDTPGLASWSCHLALFTHLMSHRPGSRTSPNAEEWRLWP